MLIRILGISRQTSRGVGIWESGANRLRKGHGIGLAVIYIILGGIVGSVLGHLLAPVWSPLGRPLLTIGSVPGTTWSINLGVVGLQVGGWLEVNLVGLIGMIVGLFWFRRGA